VFQINLFLIKRGEFQMKTLENRKMGIVPPENSVSGLPNVKIGRGGGAA
jgi:hypothetical protein